MPRKSLSTLMIILGTCVTVQAADVTWTGAQSNDWDNGSNWSNGNGPGDADNAILNSGSLVDYEVYPSIDPLPNYRQVVQSGGVLNIIGGEMTASSTGNGQGTSQFNGTVNQTGGDLDHNRIQIGNASGASGSYNLSGGELRIARGTSGNSLFVGGLSTGAGTFTISGGSFITRAGVKVGDPTNTGLGTFAVVGTGASEIGIGSAGTDTNGTWEQYSGSSLKVSIDGGGCTPIFLRDNGGTYVTSATFASGALLDVGFIGANSVGTGGTWTVMEVENGDITNNGLAFAPGVNTGIWSFSIDNSGANGFLRVTSTYTNASNTVTWDGSESTAWENPLNWTNNFGVFGGAYPTITTGTVDYTAASERNVNLRGFRMSGGTLNISGGTLKATSSSGDFSNLNGTTNQTGGFFDVNTLEVGSSPGNNSIYNLSEGELKIGRASGGSSLYLGTNRGNGNAGNGTFSITGGRFTTRAGVELGDATASGTGRFAVFGADASEIIIGGANTDIDGSWVQSAGSTLEVGIDFAGVTPIFIKDGSNAGVPSATFAAGSRLDVDYYNITQGGGTWVVLEVENGTINDNGLQFAPGVDTAVWSKSIVTSGANTRLLVTAIGPPIGLDITVGTTLKQKMRYGMDYERLWFWTGGLSGSERDDVARWSAVDTDIDFVRVAMNSGYELTEGTYDLSAYMDKIIPLMQEMQQANPNIKFFASPRPLNEAVSGASWQPYPLWVTGATTYTSGNYNFNDIKCAEYIVKYLLLMKSYGFKISFLDVTNEWQSNVGGGRLTQDDMDDIHEYLNVTYFNAPWSYAGVGNSLFLAPEDIPEIIAPSSWNYSQGTSWINNLDAGDKEAISIAASHNTDRAGSAQAFAAAARNQLGNDVEIWNTELHGWKSTSNENETTSFYYYIEAIRAGFGGINGWLAIGTTGQGHSYILNPSGTPERNVKYYIYRKLSSTSNYGNALEILDEPEEGVFNAPLDSNDDDVPRNVAAFIKGNLMTVWVVNENADSVPVVITPSGRTIAETAVRQTRWTNPSDVEGFTSFEPVTSPNAFGTIIPGASVCCFEIVLDSEDFSNDLVQAEDFSHSWGVGTETAGDSAGGNLNVSNISNGDFTRYGDIALTGNSIMSFRVARPSGRPDGVIEIREGDAEGPILGQVAVPETGNWQVYQTISTTLNVDAGIYNLYLKFVESTTTTNNAFVNLNWFTVNDVIVPAAPTGLTATANGSSQIDLAWNAVSGATSYKVLRSTSPVGSYAEIASGLTTTTTSDATASIGVPYYYVVRAVNGSVESLDSNISTATLSLDSPTGLAATAVGSSQIDLNWNAVAGATSYKVLRSTSPFGTYIEVASGVTATSTSDATATAGVPYFYVVRAVNGAAESASSNIASATLALDTPTGLTATNVSSSQIDLSWSSVAGATSYSVRRGTASGGPYSIIASGLGSPGHSDTSSLTPGTRYYYVVFASTTVVTSVGSAEASAVPSDPIVPENVTIESFTIGDDGFGNDVVSISIQSSGLGQFYQIMENQDLGSLWQAVSPIYLGNGGLLAIPPIPYNPANPRSFYRVKVWRE